MFLNNKADLLDQVQMKAIYLPNSKGPGNPVDVCSLNTDYRHVNGSIDITDLQSYNVQLLVLIWYLGTHVHSHVS